MSLHVTVGIYGAIIFPEIGSYLTVLDSDRSRVVIDFVSLSFLNKFLKSMSDGFSLKQNKGAVICFP